MNFWAEIRQLVNSELFTLDQKRKFSVVEVTEDEVVVVPEISGIERAIRRIDMEEAFQELVSMGVLTRSNIRKRYSNFNPAYVAALLAALPRVNYTSRPITLIYGDGA